MSGLRRNTATAATAASRRITTPGLRPILALLADVKAVFCVRIGHAPWQKLEQAGIEPCVEGAWRPVSEVLPDWWQQRRGSWPAARAQQGVA
nr:nitrogenase FeMo-cofactor synthesis FeS core scaffold and assembly protein NifB [Raoultella sp. NCTC 9187]